MYDAKLRLAEIARSAWGDDGLAERLEAEAAELQRRFDEAFWVDERGGFYALALDGDKRPVDSLCSNLGHLPGADRRRRAEPRSPAGCSGTSSGRGGGSARCRPRTRPSTRSATTTAPFGRTTRHSARGDSCGRNAGRHAPDRRRAPGGLALLRLVAAGGLRRLRPPGDRRFRIAYPDRGATAGVGGGDTGVAAAPPRSGWSPISTPGGPGRRSSRCSRLARRPTFSRALGRSWEVRVEAGRVSVTAA